MISWNLIQVPNTVELYEIILQSFVFLTYISYSKLV